jgi:rubrerythrin
MAEPWQKGDEVPVTDSYICNNCGHREQFKDGEKFTECPACHQGDPSDIWERSR